MQSWDQGWVFVFITLLIWWVRLVCKLRMLHACHLVICKGGLLVNVASITVMVMPWKIIFEFLHVKQDKYKDTGPIQRPDTNRGH